MRGFSIGCYKIFKKVLQKYLQESNENSRTWSMYVRHLSQLYGIPDPLDLMEGVPMSKSSFKEMVKTKITVFHENELRTQASTNSKMRYMNIGAKGLNGRHHPVLSEAVTTSEVKALRPVVKMLLSDYQTFESKDAQSGGGSHCRLCPAPADQSSPPNENIEHVLTKCVATADIRQMKLEELVAITTVAKTEINLVKLLNCTRTLTQYILDCTSHNLENDVRISINDPTLNNIIVTARHMVNAIHCTRIKLIRDMTKKKN